MRRPANSRAGAQYSDSIEDAWGPSSPSTRSYRKSGCASRVVEVASRGLEAAQGVPAFVAFVTALATSALVMGR
jgi:hypothetical protein